MSFPSATMRRSLLRRAGHLARQADCWQSIGVCLASLVCKSLGCRRGWKRGTAMLARVRMYFRQHALEPHRFCIFDFRVFQI